MGGGVGSMCWLEPVAMAQVAGAVPSMRRVMDRASSRGRGWGLVVHVRGSGVPRECWKWHVPVVEVDAARVRVNAWSRLGGARASWCIKLVPRADEDDDVVHGACARVMEIGETRLPKWSRVPELCWFWR